MEARSKERIADRIVLSYRSVDVDADDTEWVLADSDWIRDGMQEESYLRYLRTVHGGPVTVGDEWEEFVNCGCASPQDVIVQVESLHGGSVLGEDTEIEIVPRKEILEG